MGMSNKKSTKKENLYKYIYCDVFKVGVVIFIGDCDALKKWANKTFTTECTRDILASINTYCSSEEYYLKDVCARIYDSDCGEFVVHIPRFSFSYNTNELSTLVHELLHATFLMGDFIGIEYKYKGNNEFYTYLQEFLLKEALDKKGYKKV